MVYDKLAKKVLLGKKVEILLEDLVGEHILSGVESNTIPGPEVDCITLSFILDDITFSACEDAEDGYRSSMKELILGGKVNNTFPGIKVNIEYDNTSNCDILNFIDIITKKIVLSIGTDNVDDYYPCFVNSWATTKICV